MDGSDVTEAQFIAWWTSFVYPLCRISALVGAAPLLGMRAVPARVRVVLAIAVTFAMMPGIEGQTWPAPWTPAGSVLVANEVLVGIVLGTAVRLAFVALEACGNLLAQLMGLSFSAMIDPASGAETPVIGQFYTVLATLMYLSLDAHLALFQLLWRSFEVVPIGVSLAGLFNTAALVQMLDEIFAVGVLLALPLAAALLIVNLGFGVLSRVAPQMNLFAVGLPISTLFGVILLLFGTADVLRSLPDLFDQVMHATWRLLVPDALG